jgi:serine/threonine protein kinase
VRALGVAFPPLAVFYYRGQNKYNGIGVKTVLRFKHMIEAGTLLQNRYLVDKQIGAGGMGAVYVATDQRFGSTVAIKETFFTDENLRKAFEREARLLNSLRHPAMARVSDHFDDGSGQFLVMEFIAGEDLSELLAKRGKAFPVAEVLTWADQLLDALDYLHTQEMPVVHRDIKPQNLKLTPRGQVILLDFGLAKGNPTDSNHQTNTKSVFGYSRVYAPLEQIQGTGTDPRSDFYSLAATLYHLMTGIAPEDALTRATAVLNGHSDPLKSPHELRPEISEAVSAVIMKSMALNANFRPSSAAAMRALLGDAKNDISPFAEGETLAAAMPAAAGIFDQKTQVIGGTNTVTAQAEQAQATQASKQDSDPFVAGHRIDIPSTEVTRLSAARPRRSRMGMGLGAGALAVLLVSVCAGALYVYKPELFRQNAEPVNPISTENAAAASQAKQQEAASQEASEAATIDGAAKENLTKPSTESKESKSAVSEKQPARAENPKEAPAATTQGGNDEAAADAAFQAKQKEFQKAIDEMVRQKMRQNKNRQQAQPGDDEDDNDPDDDTPTRPNVRVFRQGDPNLRTPNRPYIFKKKKP